MFRSLCRGIVAGLGCVSLLAATGCDERVVQAVGLDATFKAMIDGFAHPEPYKTFTVEDSLQEEWNVQSPGDVSSDDTNDDDDSDLGRHFGRGSGG